MGGKFVRRLGTVLGLRTGITENKNRPNRSTLVVLGCAVLTFSIVATEIGDGQASSRNSRSRRNGRSSTVQSANGSVLDTLRSTLRQYIKAFGHAPLVYPIVNAPYIKSMLSALPGSRALYGSKWDRKHPFDCAYGTDTSGFLSGNDILTGHPAEEHGSPYAGVQPSVLRRALATLPGLEKSTFIDLGCGKGRPMLIASEFPFRDIVGVELSPTLAAAARRNAEIIGKRCQDRPPIRVEVGDATIYPMPAGDVVLFIYNSFDSELMQTVVKNVEAALTADQKRSIFVVFCNPVSGDCFDASPLLTRCFAQTLPYASDERDYAEDAEDAIIIWQGGNAAPPTRRTDGKIVIVKERWRAELHA